MFLITRIFAASHDDNAATGIFSSVQFFTDESDSETPVYLPSENFIPNPESTYYIDSPAQDMRIASNGSSEDAYTTSRDTVSADTQWKFVSDGNGGWYIDRAQGGSLARLRTDGTELADMQSSDYDEEWETFSIFDGASEGTFFLNISLGPEGFRRLQVNDDGEVAMVPTSFDGSWESFVITEEPVSEFLGISRVGSLYYLLIPLLGLFCIRRSRYFS